jgi:virginiamycin B lyase
MNVLFFILISMLSTHAMAMTIKVLDESNKPISLVMVTEKPIEQQLDKSDNDYLAPNVTHIVLPEVSKFTNEKGLISFPSRDSISSYRFRKYPYKDQIIEFSGQKEMTVKLELEEDPHQLSLAKTANIWLGQLEVGSPEDKIIFKMQCGYCHQQGNEFTRQDRSPEEWSDTIKRMVRYGSRLSSDLQKKLPQVLAENYKQLVDNPQLLAEPPAWEKYLENITLTEWPIGDEFSQTHDMLVARNGLIYVGDNIQDRIYEVNPKTNEVVVYKIPHKDGDQPGGLIAGRLADFPKHDSTSNAHSLAESHVDGHIFITPSAQRRLVEFDPTTKKFTLYEMDQGFYPHTIRLDSKDNVWFTLALSNQVAMFNRKTKEFKYYDLPARSFKEKLITKNIHLIFKLINWGIPLSNWLSIDRVSTSVPLVYGIDITPDDKVWIARLHTKEIGVINPETDEIKMIETPFWGPRRLRADKQGNLWIGSFGESKLAKYIPSLDQFKLFDLPVVPLGSETPYSLNVNHLDQTVWVNGNQSDAIYVFDINKESWKTIPFSRRSTFTRDVEFSPTGTAYTANSNFPSWHIEDSQPTLIQIETAN